MSLQLQNNSTLVVKVPPETLIHALYFKIQKIGCLALGMLYWQVP